MRVIPVLLFVTIAALIFCDDDIEEEDIIGTWDVTSQLSISFHTNFDTGKLWSVVRDGRRNLNITFVFEPGGTGHIGRGDNLLWSLDKTPSDENVLTIILRTGSGFKMKLIPLNRRREEFLVTVTFTDNEERLGDAVFLTGTPTKVIPRRR